jgi:MFS superfamily sulfate permease-like transporter
MSSASSSKYPPVGKEDVQVHGMVGGLISDIKLNYRDYVNEGVCGMINAAIIIPVMFSFANIIFRDPIFAPYLPLLSKLVMFSGVVHQGCFLIFSNFPFAVGQVQDAGLVFLSAISTDVVLLMTGKGGKGYHEHHSDLEVVTTSLVVLAICTAALGACVFLVGKLNLASVVQYLPMPVLAGYLAYIGFFCGLSSFGIMANQDVATIYDVPLLFTVKSAILIFPGVIGGILIYCSLRFLRSSLTLPLCMVTILSTFFAIMALSGMSLEEARDYGWIHPYSEPGSPLQAVELYDFSRVDWSVLLRQATKFLAMVVVVTVSSSLDIAAIEMEVGRPVDYNQELKTVGLSNLISGLCGGYTGSYIFSQTIFCLRRGVKTKICGATILLCEFLIVVFPISITAYIPKIFFGSLLMLIALDLQWEWLIASRHKMMFSEYIVSILTFVCIQFWGIESGMIIGVLAATLSFVGLYSQLEVVSVSAQRTSNAQRTFEERVMLMSKHRKVVTLTFRGYIFFGSAASLLPVLKGYMEDVVLPEAAECGHEMYHGVSAEGDKDKLLSPVCYSSGSGRAKHLPAPVSPFAEGGSVLPGFESPSRGRRPGSGDGSSPERVPLMGGTHSSPSMSDYGSNRRNSDGGDQFPDPTSTASANANANAKENSPAKVLQDIAGIRKNRTRSLSGEPGTDLEIGPMGVSNRTEFMVFDFTDAYGVDATACRSCFALVTSLLRGYTHPVTLVFTGMRPGILTLFRSHGIILEGDRVMPNLNDGLEWCEETLLTRYMAVPQRHKLHSIPSTLENLNDLQSDIQSNQSYAQRAQLERHHSMTVSAHSSSTDSDAAAAVVAPVASAPALEIPSDPTELVREDEFQRLRDIVEDYLEVHSSSMNMASAISNKYLSVNTLAKYFRIIQVEMGDLVFDINDSADSVYFLDGGLIQLLRYPSLLAIPAWDKTRSTEHLHRQLADAQKQGECLVCQCVNVSPI